MLKLDDVLIDPAVALRIPAALAQRRMVLPFAQVNGHVHVACRDANDHAALQAVARHINLPLRPEPVTRESLQNAVQRVFGKSQATSTDEAVTLGEELLNAAILQRASDLHFDPDRDIVRVRLRVDGQLQDLRELAHAQYIGVLSRFKVLAGLDIAEKRAPQDGRCQHRHLGSAQDIDIRAATLPTKHGEKLTLRLLALETDSLTLARLGLSAGQLQILSDSLQQPHGMILLTGPTGSGKTTTLYAAIRRLLSQRSLNVVTVEDPVEYDIPGVSQVEVSHGDKVSFPSALRSVLRHDPDVIMIGEIRDAQTADIAIKAALTGHLVLSTLHANSAPGVLTRLLDMGVPRYLLAATLRLAIAQRLVRRLCPACRQTRELSAAEANTLGQVNLAKAEVCDPNGCKYCAGRGYRGRTGLFEVLPLAGSAGRLIAEGADEAALREWMKKSDLPTLAADAIAKLQDGTVTPADVISAVSLE